MDFGYYKTGLLSFSEEKHHKDILLQIIPEERFIFYDVPPHSNPPEQYNLLLQLLRKDDCLYLPCLEALGFSLEQIHKQWLFITEELGADIIVLNSHGYLDSRKMRDSLGNTVSQECFLFLLEYLPAMQHTWQIQKKSTGRPRFPFDEFLFHKTVVQWLKKEITVEEACLVMGCCRSTWYKYTKERGYSPKNGHKNTV